MRVYKALINSLRAFKRGVKTEPALRQEVCLAVFMVPAAFWVGENPGVLIFSIITVISIDALNTSIEKLCDIISPDYSEIIGCIKDLGSLAVLASIIGALAVWIPSLWNTIQNFH
jgi:diacylglycerol kinase (ATP)